MNYRHGNRNTRLTSTVIRSILSLVREKNEMANFTLSTFGTWAHGPAKLTSSYHDETTVRVDAEGRSRVLTEREWLQMYDDIRDAGYTRA